MNCLVKTEYIIYPNFISVHIFLIFTEKVDKMVVRNFALYDNVSRLVITFYLRLTR